MFHHVDDNGELSIFAGENELLFACSEGHYWIIEADKHDVAPGSAAKDSSNLEAMAQAFGPRLDVALGLKPTD
jgi:hypothetical protein